eukprot:2146555-Pyramimonas_sp.AAC.1
MAAAWLVITRIDSETSGASVFRIQSFELCLLPELGLRKYSHCASYPDRAVGLVIREVDLQTSDASTCRMQRSEFALTLELGLPNYSYYSNHLERCCRFSH